MLLNSATRYTYRILDATVNLISVGKLFKHTAGVQHGLQIQYNTIQAHYREIFDEPGYCDIVDKPTTRLLARGTYRQGLYELSQHSASSTTSTSAPTTTSTTSSSSADLGNSIPQSVEHHKIVPKGNSNSPIQIRLDHPFLLTHMQLSIQTTIPVWVGYMCIVA